MVGSTRPGKPARYPGSKRIMAVSDGMAEVPGALNAAGVGLTPDLVPRKGQGREGGYIMDLPGIIFWHGVDSFGLSILMLAFIFDSVFLPSDVQHSSTPSFRYRSLLFVLKRCKCYGHRQWCSSTWRTGNIIVVFRYC